MKSRLRSWVIFAAFIIIIFIFAVFLLNSNNGKTIKNFSEVYLKFSKGEIVSFTLKKDNTLVMTDNKEVTYNYKIRNETEFYNELRDIITEQTEKGTLKEYEYEPTSSNASFWLSLIPLALVVIGIIILWRFAMKQMSAGGGIGKMNSFGKAKPRLGSDEKKRVLFSDVAGADEEKEELREIVEFLRDVKKYTKLGARIPHGILLVGPPGTGKTLLAKAVAGEAGVPFYSISGSDFVEMYVGVGASRVRDLFDTARKNTASIIFIDEIDAVGRHRGSGLGGGHDEREQTLNQLLVEMDGFGSHDGIVVMAATNRLDILDPALLRPGRFDRQITVHYPDMKGREEILKVHAKNKPFEEGVDLAALAKRTAGFTGADLANLLNEAALLAARKGKSLIGQNDLEEAALRAVVGTSKKSHKRLEEENRITAYHEAGHAVACYYLDKLDPVSHITIVPTSRAGGFTMVTPLNDKDYVSKTEMEQEIVMSLGGRVAEMLIFNDLSTGASSDIKTCTSIASNMVTKYGMSDKLGSVVYGTEHYGEEVFLGKGISSKGYSDKTAAEIDAEIRRIVDNAYNECTKILTEHKDKLEFVAQFLLKYETMDGDQFAAAMSADPTPTFEELEAINAEKRRKSEEENERRRKYEEDAKKRDEDEASKRDIHDREFRGEPRTRNPFAHNPQDDFDDEEK